MTEISIRVADPKQDMNALRALLVRLQDRQHKDNPDLPTGEELVDGYLKFMWRRIDKRGGRVFLAEAQGTLIGFINVLMHVPRREPDDPFDEHALISELYVEPDYRGQGIAANLVEAGAQAVKKAQVAELRVGADAGNEAAAKLYGKLGFRPLMTLYGRRLE
jgi:ribosomal protein S18 acetylase RimI-like enzyme